LEYPSPHNDRPTQQIDHTTQSCRDEKRGRDQAEEDLLELDGEVGVITAALDNGTKLLVVRTS